MGGKLIETGLKILKSERVDWVFVLGHESYYPKFRFSPAQKQGFDPPYPFPEEFTNAWKALALTPTSINKFNRMVILCDTFYHPRCWGE